MGGAESMLGMGIGRRLGCLAAAMISLALTSGCETRIAPLLPPPDEPVVPIGPAESAATYASLCASCHGEVGEGGLGPRLIDLDTPEPELAFTIDRDMPLRRAEECVDGCAAGLAHFIKTRLTSEALRCEGPEPGPRRLRMLNRREYDHSVRDLLALRGPVSTPTPATCEPTTFRYEPGGRALTSVYVAGSFNDWNATAWPMDRDGAAFVLTRALPVGTHQYKLVLDGTEWVTDPTNPRTADDGFGGLNSEVAVTCDASATPPAPSGEGDALALTEGFPRDPRPEGFAFDTSATALTVTSVHVDEMMRAAARATEASDLSALAACGGASRDDCVRGFVDRFGRRAFRRPLTVEESGRYLALASDAPDVEAALDAVTRAMLVSPSFLYRSELGVAQADGTYRLSGYEVASALSYGLLATTPDEALLDAAESGALDTPAGIEAEARRLLADPRARDALAAFIRQWLGLEGLLEATKVAPEFDAALAAEMIEETERLALHVILDGGGRFEDLLTADYTFLTPRLAALYGYAAPSERWARVAHPDGRRRGILGQASVLASTAHSDQSSPIRRGLLVRRRLLCQEFPPPPPNAGGVPDVDPDATTRERFAQHTSNATCASCHRYIDPIGFGFERFGPIGEWRTEDQGLPIDPGGDMVDVEGLGRGTSAPFTELSALAETLGASEAAPACFARQAYRYVRGARETIDERCAIEALEDRFRAAEGDVVALFVAIFIAEDFLVRRETP